MIFFFAEIELHVSCSKLYASMIPGNQSQDTEMLYFQFLVTRTPHTQIQPKVLWIKHQFLLLAFCNSHVQMSRQVHLLIWLMPKWFNQVEHRTMSSVGSGITFVSVRLWGMLFQDQQRMFLQDHVLVGYCKSCYALKAVTYLIRL